MDYIINGGRRLCGEVPVYGSKNCALALLGATPLTEDEIVLHSCPKIEDVSNMLRLLTFLGKNVKRQGDTVAVSGAIKNTVLPDALTKLLRGSGLLLGSLLGRYGSAELPLTGGCAIGQRPMDIHFDGLRQMGVMVCNTSCGKVSCMGYPQSVKYRLRFASVGATENLVCAAVRGKGNFLLSNCAVEPEVTALCELLNLMGAKIYGAQNSVKQIEGVSCLHGCEYTIIPDRIVACTYLAAGAVTGGDVRVTQCAPLQLFAFLRFLKRCGAKIAYDENSVRVTVKKTLRAAGRIVTAPYPFFPTDAQSLAMSLAACSVGDTQIVERLFENRLAHNAEQLKKMGAKILVDNDTAFVKGGLLSGAEVSGADLRGEAALLVAALAAQDKTVLGNVSYIQRGYDGLGVSLCSLGADISQV